MDAIVCDSSLRKSTQSVALISILSVEHDSEARDIGGSMKRYVLIRGEER